jgi:hypothetical protein
VFDFSGLPDGELDTEALETTLDICPVLAARRVNGKLEVTLLNRFMVLTRRNLSCFHESEVIE